jgi:hypothetical protein
MHRREKTLVYAIKGSRKHLLACFELQEVASNYSTHHTIHVSLCLKEIFQGTVQLTRNLDTNKSGVHDHTLTSEQVEGHEVDKVGIWTAVAQRTLSRRGFPCP